MLDQEIQELREVRELQKWPAHNRDNRLSIPQPLGSYHFFNGEGTIYLSEARIFGGTLWDAKSFGVEEVGPDFFTRGGGLTLKRGRGANGPRISRGAHRERAR